MELSARSWIMGQTLRLLRENTGRKAHEVTSQYLQCSTSRLFSIESGYRQLNSLELSGLVSDAYHRPDLLPILEALRQEIAHGDGPVKDPIARHPGTSLYEELERMATQILNVCTDCVPGLCQTEDYVRREYMMEGNDHATASRYALARMSRQDRLLDRPSGCPTIDHLITESAIHRAAYVPGQLAKLADRCKHPNFTIRVILNSTGPRPTVGTYTLLEFDGLPTVLSTHVVAGGGLIGDQDDVELAMMRRNQLAAIAETPEHTLKLIEATPER